MGGPTHLQVHDVILWYHDIIQAIFEQKSPLDTSYRKSQMLAIKWKAKWPLVWDVPQLVSTWIFCWKSHIWYLSNMKYILNRYVGGSSHAAPPTQQRLRKIKKILIFSKMSQFEHFLLLQIGFIHSNSLSQA